MNTSNLGAEWRIGAGIGSSFLLYLWFGITADQSTMDQMAIHLGSDFIFGFLIFAVYTLVMGVFLAILALSPERFVKTKTTQVVEKTTTRHSTETATSVTVA